MVVTTPPDPHQQVRAHFEQDAATYPAGEPRQPVQAVDYRRTRDALMRALDPGTGDAVLEVGCGKGRWSRLVAPLVRSYTGLDITAGMLEHARAVVDAPNATFVHADFLEWRHDGPPFDAVFSVRVLEYFRDKRLMAERLAALVLLGEAQPVASRLSAGESFAAFAASSVGITGTFYATGMLVGWGSSRNTIVRMAPMAYLLLLPAAFFKGELDVGETAPFQGALLWAVLLLAYGVGAAVFAARRGHEYALPEAAKRARRRARREKMREE